jgi:hypothetical protein
MFTISKVQKSAFAIILSSWKVKQKTKTGIPYKDKEMKLTRAF